METIGVQQILDLSEILKKFGLFTIKNIQLKIKNHNLIAEFDYSDNVFVGKEKHINVDEHIIIICHGDMVVSVIARDKELTFDNHGYRDFKEALKFIQTGKCKK